MIVAKQVADFFTITRALLFMVFPWMGIIYGAAGLPLAALTMIYSWASDSIDGTLARRSSRAYRTWIGDHDLEVDMLAAIGLLIYMLLSDYISTRMGAMYLAGWVFIFVFLGFHRSLGMTFQAPIYGWFLWVAIRDAPVYGLLMIAWIVGAVIISWPRFPKEVIPGFLQGFRSIGKMRR
jgi:cardiolipin synthase (CMP-forming)